STSRSAVSTWCRSARWTGGGFCTRSGKDGTHEHQQRSSPRLRLRRRTRAPVHVPAAQGRPAGAVQPDHRRVSSAGETQPRAGRPPRRDPHRAHAPGHVLRLADGWTRTLTPAEERVITELLLASLGYVLAALCLGLWWGERGRRLDAQRREGVIQVDR